VAFGIATLLSPITGEPQSTAIITVAVASAMPIPVSQPQDIAAGPILPPLHRQPPISSIFPMDVARVQVVFDTNRPYFPVEPFQ
jgi:hypothetical protein